MNTVLVNGRRDQLTFNAGQYQFRQRRSAQLRQLHASVSSGPRLHHDGGWAISRPILWPAAWSRRPAPRSWINGTARFSLRKGRYLAALDLAEEARRCSSSSTASDAPSPMGDAVATRWQSTLPPWRAT